jgi:hypothetical protein
VGEFSSIADILLAPATGPGGEQAYLEVRCASPPAISLLSRNTAGSAAALGQASFQGPGVTGDGDEAVFAGQFGLSGCCHLYLRDLGAGTTTQLDRASGETGASANGELEFFAISADGCRAAFESRATNLVAEAAPDPAEEPTEVYVRQLAPCVEPPGGEGGSGGGGGSGPGGGEQGPGGFGSGGASQAGSSPSGAMAVSGGIASVHSLRLTGGRVVADVGGPATFTVRIRRLVATPRRHWRLVRGASSFSTFAAGPASYALPSLGPGTYRLNVHLSGMPEGESFVRRLTVVAADHP